MGSLTDDMRRVVEQQQLGFVATVCPDGTPNLSLKGTTAVWDNNHLIFADICSPATIGNLRLNPGIEINVVDMLARKGYRFKGTATVFDPGPQSDDVFDFYLRRGSTTPKHHIVLVKVAHAAPLISPAYDSGQTEQQIRSKWRLYWESLWGRNAAAGHA